MTGSGKGSSSIMPPPPFPVTEKRWASGQTSLVEPLVKALLSGSVKTSCHSSEKTQPVPTKVSYKQVKVNNSKNKQTKTFVYVVDGVLR
jgi:hypothetical protein